MVHLHLAAQAVMTDDVLLAAHVHFHVLALCLFPEAGISSPLFVF